MDYPSSVVLTNNNNIPPLTKYSDLYSVTSLTSIATPCEVDFTTPVFKMKDKVGQEGDTAFL